MCVGVCFIIATSVDNVSVDVSKMLAQKDKSVKTLTGGIEGLFKKNKVNYVKGWGRLASPNEVEVDMNDGSKKKLWAKNIMIATGSDVMTIPGVVVYSIEWDGESRVEMQHVHHSSLLFGHMYRTLRM